MTLLNKVIGIGASAGGLEAIQTLFTNIDNTTNCAFIIVQHLSPKYKSMMSELLQKHTSMEVKVISKTTLIEPNTIYLIPNNKNIVVSNGCIKLTQRETNGKINLPIDLLLTSLGKEYKENAVGIILSGTGSDGSRGIETIKENDGWVYIQEPHTAKFDGMPHAALDVGIENAILTPEGIAEVINNLGTGNSKTLTQSAELDENTLKSINIIVQHLKKSFNIDFSLYKYPTVFRRIDKRMKTKGVETMDVYIHILQNSHEESTILKDELFINVSSFFRDGEPFLFLEEKIIPEIFHQKGDFDTIRIWSMACSTGQEAYSLAYLIQKHQRNIKSKCEFTVFATDLDPHALKKASDGLYFEHELEGIAHEIKEQMFDKEGKTFKVKKELRNKVIFSKHDALKDPPFINIDLLVCRNFMIYLKNATQMQLVQQFNFSLNMNGFLFLGKSESIRKDDLFLEYNKRHNIYKKVKQSLSFFHRDASFYEKDKELPSMYIMKELEKENIKKNGYDLEFTDYLIADYAPTCVFIDEKYNVLYMNGELELILSFPQRIAKNFNLIKMTNDEGATLFKSGVKKTLEDNKSISYENIPISKGKKEYLIDIRFIPYRNSFEEEKIVLIEFTKIAGKNTKNDNKPSVDTKKDFTSDRLKTLEYEIRNLEREKKILLQQVDTQHEELNASNEELLASNEELQSTNEELQSVNEELYSVNSELQEKIKELNHSNADLNNLLEGIDIGTIFLDKELNIRKFTPSVTSLIHLNKTDIGRNIGIFSSTLINPEIQKSCLAVLVSGTTLEKEVADENHNTYLMRILPYVMDAKHEVEGMIITFIDITKIKNVELKIRDSEERFKLAAEGTSDGIWDWYDVSDDNNVWWSPRFFELLGYPPEEITMSTAEFNKLLHPDDVNKANKAFEILVKENQPFDVEYRIHTKNNGYRWFRARGALKRNDDGTPVRMVGSISDIHDEKEHKKNLDDQQRTLNTIIEGTLAGFWDWDIPGNYEYMSDSFKKMFGYQPEEIPDTPDWWQENIHQDDLPKVMECFDKHIKSKGKVPYDNLVRYYHKNGDLVWVYCRGKVIEWDKKGNPLRMVGSHVDVTNLIETELALKARTTELEKSNRELQQFAYIATHDLRAPIINIKGLVNLFKEFKLVNKDNEELIEKIDISLNTFTDTLDDLIDITKIRKNTKEPIQDVVIRNIIESQSVIINERYSCSPKLTLDLKSNAIKYQPAHIKSIIFNLYSNAVKYRRKDVMCEIKISTYEKDSLFYLEFEDNGKGFDMSKKDKVFGMFQRLDGDTDGKGIGLYVVKSIIESENGSIDVVSTLGEGTKFTIILEEKKLATEAT